MDIDLFPRYAPSLGQAIRELESLHAKQVTHHIQSVQHTLHNARRKRLDAELGHIFRY